MFGVSVLAVTIDYDTIRLLGLFCVSSHLGSNTTFSLPLLSNSSVSEDVMAITCSIDYDIMVQIFTNDTG
jgi:hypothetical protein